MSNTEPEFRVEWIDDIPVYTGRNLNIQSKEINWKIIERNVYKLQKRIFFTEPRVVVILKLYADFKRH
jgi:hypothetical protein